MFCQKCNLHYPEHLSFCRRCGQPLARSTSDHAVDSHCCTRCGARVVRGENFCQQCGNRIGVALQDTVIGACYHCGTSWRSGWLFCKNCGLDRKRALLLSTSSPSSPISPAITQAAAKSGAAEPLEALPEIAKINCQFCGAEAKPFSRFCESCGKRLDGSSAGTKMRPAAAVPAQPDPQSAKIVFLEPQRASAATILEPPPLIEDSAPAVSGELGSELDAAPPPLGTSSAKLSNNISTRPDNGSSVEFVAAERRVSVEPHIANPTAVTSQEMRPEASETVITPLPPFGRIIEDNRPATTAGDIWARNRRAILQSVVLIGLAVLLVAIAVWWMSRSRQKGAQGSATEQAPSSAAQSQPGPPTSTAGPTNPSGITAPEGMVYVPGGRFEMGRSDGDEYERPAHAVTVESFFIDRTEVTNEQYQRFLTETSHHAPTHWQNGKFAPGEAKLPVTNVSWDDANAYANWAGRRLPTEAEWEFAARGADGRLYPWGNAWNASYSNAGHANSGHIVEVGRFPAGASPFGALDMCGNVWEWTASSLQSYAEDHHEIAPGKVIRGGAFDVPSDRATTTYRGVLPADRLRDKTGFRTARSLK